MRWSVAYLGIEARLVSGRIAGREAYETLLRPGRALDQRVRSVDFAVVGEAAVDRRVCAVADVDEALVQFRPLVVAGLACCGTVERTRDGFQGPRLPMRRRHPCRACLPFRFWTPHRLTGPTSLSFS